MQWVQKPVLVLNATQVNFWDAHQAEILKAVLNLSDGHIQMTFLVKSTKRIKAYNSPKGKQKKVYHKRWSPSTNNYIPRFKSDTCLNKSKARTRKGKKSVIGSSFLVQYKVCEVFVIWIGTLSHFFYTVTKMWHLLQRFTNMSGMKVCLWNNSFSESLII